MAQKLLSDHRIVGLALLGLRGIPNKLRGLIFPRPYHLIASHTTPSSVAAFSSYPSMGQKRSKRGISDILARLSCKRAHCYRTFPRSLAHYHRPHSYGKQAGYLEILAVTQRDFKVYFPLNPTIAIHHSRIPRTAHRSLCRPKPVFYSPSSCPVAYPLPSSTQPTGPTTGPVLALRPSGNAGAPPRTFLGWRDPDASKVGIFQCQSVSL